jgi:TRAP-type uncharacterized transport system fused permease subunit
MQEAGAGQWFINLAVSVARCPCGGVAKSTIVASGLFEMITGSPSSEAATIGSITIPMMVSTGIPPKVAAGIEAAAGTGGQFMPPVMGAIAFIMAEWLATPYPKWPLLLSFRLVCNMLYSLCQYSLTHGDSALSQPPFRTASTPDFF